jgi:calcium binding protein
LKRPSENKDREDRIIDEIVVDAYGEEERAMGWYYYAADAITFPFKARCAIKCASSPLRIGDTVEVASMASEDDCMHELMVLITWKDENLAVPLVQLKPSPASTDLTRQAVADWHYWVARGYRF